MKRKNDKSVDMDTNAGALSCPHCATPDHVRIVESHRLAGLDFIVKCRVKCMKCQAIFATLIYHVSEV